MSVTKGADGGERAEEGTVHAADGAAARPVDRAVSLLQDTTMHGLPRVLDKDSRIRATFWMLLTVSVTFFLAFFLRSRLEVFLERGTTTTDTSSMRPSLPFPAVTVCNANPLRASALVNTTREGRLNGVQSGLALSADEIWNYGFRLQDTFVLASFDYQLFALSDAPPYAAVTPIVVERHVR